jgi:hypothetical protein
MLKKMMFKKCPLCRSWVEKNAGCTYIACKCGTDFCYRCGELFDRDPCRKNKEWRMEARTRGIMASLPNIFSTKRKDLALFVPRVAWLLAVVLPFTILFSMLLTTTAVLFFCLFGLWIVAALPMLLFPICTEPDPLKFSFYLAALILLYPLWFLCSFFYFLFFILGYPCLRNRYRHGVETVFHDTIDKILSKVTLAYLISIKFILRLVNCSDSTAKQVSA